MGTSVNSQPSNSDELLVPVSCSVVGVCSAYPTYYYPQQEYFPMQQEYDTILVRVPRQIQGQEPKPFNNRPIYKVDRSDDLEAAADTPYAAAPVGRVKIQTYRGPSDGGELDSPPGDTITPSPQTWQNTIK